MSTGGGERHGAAAALLGGERPTIEQLWLDTLGRIASRAAHEIKGALNGVSVNLEVVRGRAAKPDAPASAVQRYAESAAEQMEELTRLSEALLAVARPLRPPVDVAGVLRRLLVLLSPATAAEGGRLELASVPEEPALGPAPCVTSAAPDAVRLALGAALLAAIEPKGRVVCAVTVDDAVVRVTMDCSAGERIDLSPVLVEALGESGIALAADGCSLSLALPRAGRGAPTSDRA